MLKRTAGPIFAFIVVAAAFVGTFAAQPGGRIHGDGYYSFLWLRSITQDVDLDLTNDYKLCGDPWGMAKKAHAGKYVPNTWSMGATAVWAPIFLVARELTGDARSRDKLVAAGCSGRAAEAATFGSVLASLLALCLGYRLCRRYMAVGPASFAVLATGLTTSLLYYGALLPSYTHAPAALGVALFVERWDALRSKRDSIFKWLVLGLCLGFAMILRPQSGVVALAPLCEWVILATLALRERRLLSLAKLVSAGFLFVFAAVLVFFPQLFVWKMTYGTWWAVPQGAHYMRWADPHLDGVLFATANGLLVHTPFVYLACVGLVLGVLRKLPGLRWPTVQGEQARLLLGVAAALFVVTVYVNAAVWDYWGSVGFSNRRFTEAAVLFQLGFSVTFAHMASWAKHRPGRAAALAAVLTLGAATGWNYSAMWAQYNGDIRPDPIAAPDLYSTIFSRMVRQTHKAVGNPLAWPAALPFAAYYHTTPDRYDWMNGPTVNYQDFNTFVPKHGREVVKFSDWMGRNYSVQGFEVEPKRIQGSLSMVSTGRESRMLLPMFAASDVGSIELRWRNAQDEPVVAREKTKPSAAPAAMPIGVRALRNPLQVDARVPAEDIVPSVLEAEPAAVKPIYVGVLWNRRWLGRYKIPARWGLQSIPIPQGLMDIGINEVRFSITGGTVAFDTMRLIKRPGLPAGGPVPAEVAPAPVKLRGH